MQIPPWLCSIPSSTTFHSRILHAGELFKVRGHLSPCSQQKRSKLIDYGIWHIWHIHSVKWIGYSVCWSLRSWTTHLYSLVVFPVMSYPSSWPILLTLLRIKLVFFSSCSSLCQCAQKVLGFPLAGLEDVMLQHTLWHIYDSLCWRRANSAIAEACADGQQTLLLQKPNRTGSLFII